jgi:hypothetical protein
VTRDVPKLSEDELSKDDSLMSRKVTRDVPKLSEDELNEDELSEDELSEDDSLMSQKGDISERCVTSGDVRDMTVRDK